MTTLNLALLTTHEARRLRELDARPDPIAISAPTDHHGPSDRGPSPLARFARLLRPARAASQAR